VIGNPGEGGEWVEVLVTYDSLEAEMIKDLLESGGIPVVMRSTKVRPYPVNVGKIGEVHLLVREEDREIAEKVLRGESDGEQALIGDLEGDETSGDGRESDRQ
jgi:Putative prokaryotic signal transducing protein